MSSVTGNHYQTYAKCTAKTWEIKIKSRPT